MARIRWIRNLRATVFILGVALASGYLGARLEPIRAWAEQARAEFGDSAPDLVAALKLVPEAAAQPSIAIDLSEQAPAWRASLGPEADAPSNAGVVEVATSEPAPAPEQIRPTAPTQAAVASATPRPGPQTLAVEQCWADPAKGTKASPAAATIRASFIVVGSYTDPMNALRTYSRVEDRWRATIVHTEVSGRLYRRVLVGPFDRASAEIVRRALARQGLDKTWALTANCLPAS